MTLTAADRTPTPYAQIGDPDGASKLVLDHLGLARKLAFRYAGRGEPLDELTQVAMVGLVQAANRFDPERGPSFVSFAVPTILGEIRRHFRDHCWAVHVPRPLHDLYYAVLQANDRLSGTLKRAPSVRELAEELEVSEAEIVEAQESGHAYAALSLDGPASGGDDDESSPLGELLGTEDGGLTHVENREAVRRILAQVPPRERRILLLWFFGERTQAQIAEELGMSQMHVSRLLAMTLLKVRTAILDDQAAPIEWPTPRPRQKAS